MLSWSVFQNLIGDSLFHIYSRTGVVFLLLLLLQTVMPSNGFGVVQLRSR